MKYSHVKYILIICFLTIQTTLLTQNINQKLINAVYENDHKAVSELIKNGANPNIKTSEGITPLMYAVQNGNYIIAEKLIKAGANTNAKENQVPEAIINATYNLDTAIIFLLLENGANPNVIDLQQWTTPLSFAITQNNFVITDLLLAYGAKPNVDSPAIQPLFNAIEYNADSAIIKLLIKSGAKINKKNSNGYTPVIQAVNCNNTTALKLLLKANANPKIKSSENKNALDYAFKYRLYPLIEILLPYFDKQPKINHQNAIFNNLQKQAKKIRQKSKNKYLTPYLSHFNISIPITFSYDDLFSGAKFGFQEARYNFDFNIAILTRIARKRVLIEQNQENSLQLWEKRTMIRAEINKYFNLKYTEKNISGFFIRCAANYSTGNYRGTKYSITKKYTPAIGAGIWTQTKFIKLSAGYEFIPIQTKFPHFININICFMIPFTQHNSH